MIDDNLKIIQKNLTLDIKEFFNLNFVLSKKGYIPIASILVFQILRRLPFSRYIKNNKCIPIYFCEKNMVINVKPIYKSYYNPYENFLDKNDIELNLKHIPSFSFLTKMNKSENKKSNELEKEEFLKIKLAGIEYVNKEGLLLINKLINESNQKFDFYLKFNSLEFAKENEKNTEPIVSGWLILKRKQLFLFSQINLNILLAKNGLGKICNINNTIGIYDEKICYYMNDLLEAEKDSKLRGLGIWRNQKSSVISDYAQERRFFSRISSFFKYNKVQKIILRKNFE